MAEPDDIARQVDSIYKGLLDKFHPAARQLVAAGKAYLKALHGAASSGRTYFEALQKVALQAQERPDLGAPYNIGESLHQLTSVYRELQAQELTALRAFYVDLLVPLETNIEKDVKQLQSEHKRFTSGHKQRREAHAKAAAAVKKNKKKGRARANGVDKQIKHYQALEESKGRLDTYLTQGLQAASQQERRRLGFVLERHCTLSRHHLALHSRGTTLLQGCLEAWSAVAASRDLPVETTCHPFGGDEMRELEEDAIYSTPSLELCELDSRIRRSRSMDMSALDADEQREGGSGGLPRAISALQLDSTRSDDQASSASASPRHCTSSAASGRRPVAKALYNYNAAADTQLSFTEGDTIGLIGERADGWQYGENTRTQRKGWFPVAYTEDMAEDGADSAIGPVAKASCGAGDTVTSWRSAATSETASSNTITSVGTVRAAPHASSPPISSSASRFTKTSSESYHPLASSTSYSTTQVTANIFPTLLQQKSSKNSSNKKRHDSKDRYYTNDGYSTGKHTGLKYGDRFSGKTTTLLSDSDTRSDTSLSLSCSLPGLGSSSSSTSTQRGRVSFHSSNDSGFSNDGSRPPQPTVDYSDADSYRGRCLDMSIASCDTEPLTYFPTRVQGRSYSLGRCEDHLFHKRENSRCKDCLCPCNANSNSDAKQNVMLSPSAKKILALRNNRINQKKGKSSLRRSKSLLCLGMNSCRGMPDDLMSNDYEEMFANDWYHRSLIDVSGDIPEPPKHEPPSPPCAECLTSSCSTSCTYCTSTDLDYESKSSQFHHSDRSMPNRVAMKPCKPKKRPPMPLPVEAHTPENRVRDNGPPPPLPSASTLGRIRKPDEKTKRSTSIEYKRESSNIMTKSINRLSRSLTWASPKTNQQNNKQTYMYESNNTAHNNYINSLKNSRQASSQITTIEECPNTPPLPPRSKNLIPRPSLIPPAREPVNMMTYADFIARRLSCPEGASVLDQQSNNGRHMVGKWYDLWDESTSCTEI